MKKLILLIVISFFFSCKQDKKDNSQTITNTEEVSNQSLNRVEPPNWWIGMKNTELQLLVHHDDIGDYKPSISYKGVTIKKVHKAKSPNYLFIDLAIENASEGKFDIEFTNESGDKKTHTFELKQREKPAEDYVGFNSSDALYLITPDRFVNGDISNDTPLANEGEIALQENIINRSDNYARHGGDIKGVTNHIDYIHDLGFTAIWPQPLLTNDMKEGSYHGYAVTDLYQIDPRFGTIAEYQQLSAKLKEKDMKLIMDQVANHCGLYHWWMNDLPFEDWLNYQENYETNKENWNWEVTKHSNHRRTTNQDLYASEADRKGNNQGWFVATMPDLNQRNPFMARYLIQNSIWWIETAQLDGIRQDTYPYPDKTFMSDWAGAIMTEYPNFSIVGEEWSYNPLLIGYWQEGANNKDGYDSNLKSTMDFAMQKKVVEGISEEESWDKGLVKIYEGLANDFHYASPKDIMIFPDNHDMSRIFTQMDGSVENTKMALATYAVLPRIVQMYYGTEILMDDFEKPGDHGLIRTDFPGGWEEDSVNAFTGTGLSEEQKDMQAFVSKVFNYRKNSEAIHKGKTIHFAPFAGTYFLYRTFEDETVVLILNKNEDIISIDLNYQQEIGLKGKTLKNIITGEHVKWGEVMDLRSKGVTLLTTNL
ncbi:glycoside hydrolase family 13 protein [Ichthyenterobacterium sp. W332]|uniref:Glycoside hydrolase family 13 protein n=1 Tax=Microcosmobacter mediterraneus TaxID=3075607 RepID=A0ABU2YPE5_9FLAO|nr:glycoside hydrolase family 13 protein [Ichthyenterobacterium sp. W332]MDT0558928.1 glycoside hydrolase family 13 protein [Ichthyenterobacterium sp. W332]